MPDWAERVAAARALALDGRDIEAEQMLVDAGREAQAAGAPATSLLAILGALAELLRPQFREGAPGWELAARLDRIRLDAAERAWGRGSAAFYEVLLGVCHGRRGVREILPPTALAEGLALSGEVVRLAAALFGPESAGALPARNLHAGDLSACGHHADADRFAKRTIAIARRALGADASEHAIALSNRACFLVAAAWGDADAPDPALLREAVRGFEASIAARLAAGEPLATWRARASLASALQALGDLEGAERYARAALELTEAAHGLRHMATIRCSVVLEDALRAQGRLDEAAALRARFVTEAPAEE